MPRYVYNLAKQLTLETRPDLQTLALGYDAAGRLSTQTMPRGVTTYGYDATTAIYPPLLHLIWVA